MSGRLQSRGNLAKRRLLISHELLLRLIHLSCQLVPASPKHYTSRCMGTPQNIPPDDLPPDELVELPLFPLNDVVLFPGMKLPLHIFEDRYKSMIGSCAEHDTPFGVLLISEGQEVGEPAEPVQVGTTARISDVQHLEDGRMNITTQGERRFEVVEIIQQVPYLVGLVKYLEDEAAQVSDVLVQGIRQEFTTFLKHQATIAGGWNSQVDVTSDPEQLFSMVMSSLSASVELPKELRQKLLESSNTQQRLEQLLPVLSSGNQIMQKHAEQSNPFQGNRLN